MQQKPNKIIQKLSPHLFSPFYTKDTLRLFLVFVTLDENLNWEFMLGYKSCTDLVRGWLWHGIVFHYEHNYQEKTWRLVHIFFYTKPFSLVSLLVWFSAFKIECCLEHSIDPARLTQSWTRFRKPTSAVGWVSLCWALHWHSQLSLSTLPLHNAAVAVAVSF